MYPLQHNVEQQSRANPRTLNNMLSIATFNIEDDSLNKRNQQSHLKQPKFAPWRISYLMRVVSNCISRRPNNEDNDEFIDIKVLSALGLKASDLSRVAESGYKDQLNLDYTGEAYRDLARLASSYNIDVSMGNAEDLKFTRVNTIKCIDRNDVCVLLKVSISIPKCMIRKSWRLSQYVLKVLLHRGYASTVFSGRCVPSSMDVVIKQYELHQLSKKQRYHLFREITIHARLNHVNIVQFYTAFVVRENAYIVMEKCRGLTLRQIMMRCKPVFTERDAVNLVIRPLINALTYLHEMNIVHRDVKPENLVLDVTQDSSVCLKLLDFGLSNDLTLFQAQSCAGTLQYMAPEVLFTSCVRGSSREEGEVPRRARYSLATDVWAVGVLAYELIHGVKPFPHIPNRCSLEVAKNAIARPLQFSYGVSSPARDFISNALLWDRDRRPSIAWLGEHVWLS